MGQGLRVTKKVHFQDTLMIVTGVAHTKVSFYFVEINLNVEVLGVTQKITKYGPELV